MKMTTEPFISVITPVYNGEPFLSECIESVLRQTYGNYEYIIVNNCSRDRTLEIATAYANKDNRIRVYSNEQFVGVIENHNGAFRRIAPESKYCKVVSGDDWIFPECIARLVDIAESNPSVGLVGSYQLSGAGKARKAWRVKWTELPYPSTVIPGRELCRAYLLEGPPYAFGTPTSLLYRSSLVRAQNEFYPNLTAEADTSACFKYLMNSDFGFVHQVLSYERVHEETMSAQSRRFHAYMPSTLSDLLEYGPCCLSDVELARRVKVVLHDYYDYLGRAVFHRKNRNREFWNYHKRRLADLGYPLSGLKLSKAICSSLLDSVLNPKKTAEIIVGKLGRGA